MPTYEYHCDACDHEFEEMQSFSEAPLTKCPACGKKKLRRLFGTGAGFIFKGSGFYETDYRSDSYKQAAKADQEKASGKKDEAKGGGDKPDTKSTNGATDKPGGKEATAKPTKGKSSGKSPKSEP
jgi:putative FmdB family regulatory protein